MEDEGWRSSRLMKKSQSQVRELLPAFCGWIGKRKERQLLPQGDSGSSTTAAFRYSFEDEDELMKKIRDTYNSDKYAIAVKPLLYIIDVIFYGATDLRGFIEVSLSHETINLQVQDMVEELPTTVISAITYQLFSKCLAGENVHIISMEVLEIIKDYNWDSKVVLTFLDFAVIFGECHLKRLVKLIDIIQNENLSRTLDWNILWYFWVRLESMLYSKKLTQRGKCDIIMQGIIALLSYDSEHKNWAIISNGTGKIVVANGEHMLRGLCQLWKMKSRENNTGFVDALDEYICKTYPAPAAPDKYASDILTATVPKKDYEVFKVVERILVSTNIHDSKSRGIKLPYKCDHRAVNSFYNKKRPITGGDTRVSLTKPGGVTALPTPAKWGGNQKKYPARVHRLCTVGGAIAPHFSKPHDAYLGLMCVLIPRVF
ncbi:Sieve element occlusion, N-terminal [Parasponia andersonii]|uniref:Sieve element occlusion, N-terminal n=1 Tax=Parasponia andersonii TaxID=3476 RepID=A0A2P5AWM2_PARAD|nr:Sieve element occlusion, N-terminal [Parasponia andersonii]